MQKYHIKFWIISTLLFFAALTTSYFLFAIRVPISDSSEPVVFIVAEGEGFVQIAQKLAAHNFIRSKRVFMLYAVLRGYAGNLRPGVYEFSSDMNTAAITKRLSVGGDEDIAVTIPEGYTLLDIEITLQQGGVLMPGDFVRAYSADDFSSEFTFLKGVSVLEGFLFPDTYRFFPLQDSAKVVKKFLKNFETKAISIGLLAGGGAAREPGELADYLGRSPSLLEVVTMASIIEREVPSQKDRFLVSGLLWKRLKVGMALQVDATIIYAKCNGFILECAQRKITREDLKIDSPFNTYANWGLPRAPIANPGQSALEAAISPQFSDYWFYLSDQKTQDTIFAIDLEEHIDNRARYLGL